MQCYLHWWIPRKVNIEFDQIEKGSSNECRLVSLSNARLSALNEMYLYSKFADSVIFIQIHKWPSPLFQLIFHSGRHINSSVSFNFMQKKALSMNTEQVKMRFESSLNPKAMRLDWTERKTMQNKWRTNVFAQKNSNILWWIAPKNVSFSPPFVVQPKENGLSALQPKHDFYNRLMFMCMIFVRWPWQAFKIRNFMPLYCDIFGWFNVFCLHIDFQFLSLCVLMLLYFTDIYDPQYNISCT